MPLLSHILTLDRELTIAINGWYSPIWDSFFTLVSDTIVWIPFFIILIFCQYRSWGWRKTLFFLLLVALAVLFADQSCNIFKYTVCRLRPSHEPSLAGMVHTVNGYLGGDFGFCSSHAANAAAVAILTSLFIRRWLCSLMFSIWVILVCWSRIYLGVHYLGDILFGLLLGAFFSVTLYLIWRKTKWGRVSFYFPFQHTIVLSVSWFMSIVVLMSIALLTA